MSTGTPIVIGFYPSSQLACVDERKFKENIPYASTADVLATLPEVSRAPYLIVNVAGVDYWFDPDIYTLVPYVGSLSIADASIVLAKFANLPANTVIGNITGSSAVPIAVTIAALKTALGLIGTNGGDQDLSVKVDKVTGSSLIAAAQLANLANQSGNNSGDETTASIKSKLSITTLSGDNTGDQDISVKVDKVTGKDLSTNDYTTDEKTKLTALLPPQRISFGAYSSVAARVAGATVTTDYPTGWTLAVSSVTNLLITHTLTGRKLAGCNIFEIDGANERMLSLKETYLAYTGILCNGLTVLIEGLAPTALAIRIELIFD